MVSREQKAQLPIAAKRHIAPAYFKNVHFKNRSNPLGGGGWKWCTKADGRPWEVPGRTQRGQAAAYRPYGSPGSVPWPSARSGGHKGVGRSWAP